MWTRSLVTLISVTGLSACVGTAPEMETAGLEQVCAARLAAQENVPLSSIRVVSSGPTLTGTSTIVVQTFDASAQATCEATSGGQIVGFGAPAPSVALGAELQAVGEAAVQGIDTTNFDALGR